MQIIHDSKSFCGVLLGILNRMLYVNKEKYIIDKNIYLRIRRNIEIFCSKELKQTI